MARTVGWLGGCVNCMKKSIQAAFECCRKESRLIFCSLMMMKQNTYSILRESGLSDLPNRPVDSCAEGPPPIVQIHSVTELWGIEFLVVNGLAKTPDHSRIAWFLYSLFSDNPTGYHHSILDQFYQKTVWISTPLWDPYRSQGGYFVR